MSKESKETIGILGYTLVPSTTTTASALNLSFLFFRSKELSTIQSNKYYSQLNVRKEKSEDSFKDTICAKFAVLSRGEYSTSKEELSKNARIKLMESQVNKKIMKMEGVALLTDTFNMFYIIPLKYINVVYNNYDTKWISLKDILRELIITKDNANIIVNNCPISLPFINMLRSNETRETLDVIINEIQAKLPNHVETLKEMEDSIYKEIELMNSMNILKSILEDEEVPIKIEDIQKYNCKNCRTLIFTSQYIVEHELGAGQIAFLYEKRSKYQNESTCNSIFLNSYSHPFDISSNDGKLACPKCQVRVGTYTQSGDQCSCGQWIAPSFKMDKNKVDSKDEIKLNIVRPINSSRPSFKPPVRNVSGVPTLVPANISSN